MSTIIERGADGRHVHVTHTRGDRLAIVLRIDGSVSDAAAARLAAWSGADWLAQVRRTPDTADPVATFSVSEVVDGDVGLWTFVVDETAGMDGSYVFDFQIDSGPLAPYTYLAGSTLDIDPDVSRAVTP